MESWQRGSKTTECASLTTCCRRNLLLVLTISAVFCGLGSGFLLRPLALSSETIKLVGFPGEIFLRALKLMILPLIFTSLISGSSILQI
ncbi:Amino acid transporter [Aphelenchoides fujianensis]|nr:Amino acid transporter [Aphelenchoides fujianensis]KAI6238679.1 Amino acid transporter [Aphelenchoides fujianensis]